MNSTLPPEQRRDRLTGTVNRILAKVLSDDGWAGDAADRAAVRDYGDLSRAQGNLVSWADAAWLASLLMERAGELDGAEHELAALQVNQDLARRNVTGMSRVARVTGKYRFLPPRLAALRYRLKQGASALFDAIEWAKCRALSDAAGDATAPHFADLQNALAGTRTHYLTFLVDSAKIFAVLATADRKSSVGQLPIGREHIHGYAHPDKIDPKGRAGFVSNVFASSGDWTQLLEPLVGLVDAAFAARQIVEHDTLLVSPHGVLHLFPLHELALASAGGRAVGEVVAVVRVHGAADVLRRIAAGPPVRPKDAVMLRAPLQEELDNEHDAATFPRCAALLAAKLTGRVVCRDREAATAGFVLDELGPERLFHLACHGHILPRGPAMERSFLVLASGTKLARRLASDGAVPAGALTPSLVRRRAETLAGNDSDPAPLHGTHVTLQACVSGHAAANPQGDAVGLEWAFLMAGAASTLGTHWHVDGDDAAIFTESFYAAWFDGASRAAAWAAAGAALRKLHEDGRWAAFSLTGEWR